MAASTAKPKLVVIVGPTASGKSELAINIARKHRGEIISVDSRGIYKGMDIGTAKPTKKEQKGIIHWGLDLIEPGQSFTAADFKAYANKKIKEIKRRHHLPILVGGTGLYIDSVLFDFQFRPLGAHSREVYESLSVPALQQLAKQRGFSLPKNKENKRHLIRILEANGHLSIRRPEPLNGSIIVGILPTDETLRERISKRAERIFEAGVLSEYIKLQKKYPSADPASIGIVYKVCSEILKMNMTEQEAIQKFKTLDWQYARRQRTWFKRNSFIKWFNDVSSAEQYIDNTLNT